VGDVPSCRLRSAVKRLGSEMRPLLVFASIVLASVLGLYLAGLAPAVSANRNSPPQSVVSATEAWMAVKDTSSIAILEEFRRRYPDTPYAAFAAARIDELKKLQAAPPVTPVVPPRPDPSRSAVGSPPVVPSVASVGCTQCPEMVIVPSGSFTMGSLDGEGDERPQRAVTIRKPFAVGKFHITVDQFAAFVAETGHDAGSSCYTFEGGKWDTRQGRSWRNPGFSQNGSHPAVCVSWYDAKTYVDWLARKTGKRYRLLTEAEWEFAARAQTKPSAYPKYSFGSDERELCRYGNGTDQTTKSTVPGAGGWAGAPCNDGYAYTSPVGSFAANSFGLYDMQGNAFQWTEDCYHKNYVGAPADSSAWTTGECLERVFRGGSWAHGPSDLRAAVRYHGVLPAFQSNYLGFRLASTL
jgi:formylglycine-generating enzyme required for sulfatase activity